jgi:RND family efflux transporter MFP subunit
MFESYGRLKLRVVFAMVASLSSALLNGQELEGFDCMIEPHSVANVSTREEGVLEELLVKRGDIVQKGQVVARLESGLERIALEFATARAEMTGEVESRQAALEYARRQQDRVDQLFADSLISDIERDRAETDVRIAEADLQVTEDNQRLAEVERQRAAHRLELRSIRSPVDGVIVEIMMVPGESVEDRAREIMRIAEVDPLNVEVIMPARLFGSVSIGTEAEVMPLVPNAVMRRSWISVVDRTIDAASETFGVQLELDNEGHEIPGGVRCDVRFMAASDAAASPSAD